MATLTETIADRLRERDRESALLWNDRTFSSADLASWSAELAGGFRMRGVRAGDRVAVGLPNSPELIAAVLAVLRSGAVLVPLNPAYTADEAGYILQDSGATLILTHPDQANALAGRFRDVPVVCDAEELRGPAAEWTGRSPVDPALIVYTSGTTGHPKGVVLSEGALLDNLDTVASAWRWTARDRLLLALPCFHLHGLALGILGSLLAGSSIVLRARFSATEVPALIGRYRCTMFFGVPTMYNRLVTLPDTDLQTQLSTMRLWVSGSAPLTPATFEQFRERFGHEILERFGMSEGGFMIGAPYDGPRQPGVVGVPFPGIEVEIADPDAADTGSIVIVPDGEPGELLLRGPNLFSGYWRQPEATRRAYVAGFFRSGDLALRQPDGMIRIVGRRSVDIIKSGGFKISAVEIENCLQSHPAVAEVAVVGLPDADRGEVIVAAVIPTAPEALSPEELHAFAREHLAPHKVPARIVFVEDIPRTGPGKFKKRDLIHRLKSA